MPKSTLQTLLSSLVLYSMSAYCDIASDAACPGPQTYRANNKSLPFLDLRGHVFNDGRFAANAGIGYRHLCNNYVFGGNVFYDYRNTNTYHYNQIGAGLEMLTKRWDFRINGYLPVGSKQSPWYQNTFGGFSGHTLLVKRKQEFCMKGLDAEGGIHSDKVKSFSFYGGLGPYYYEGKGVNAYGGRARLAGFYKSYVSLEFTDTFDNVFHNIFQTQVTLSFPFGRKTRSKQTTSTIDCSSLAIMQDRLVQPVIRDEIIVAKHRRKNSLAIDPITKDPYYFLFVDNTSHSLGTIESPYPTLDDAINASSPGDILYVFPGDGTNNGLNTDVGYQLLDNQQLLGAATPYTFPTTVGSVVIPPQASTKPYFTFTTNPSNSAIILLGNNNTIAGLHLDTNLGTDTNNCIGTNNSTVEDLSVFDNLMEPSGSNDSGIVLSDILGTVLVKNNTINNVTAIGDAGISISSTPGFDLTAIIQNNLVSGFNLGIDVENNSTSNNLYTAIENNVISNIPSGNFGIYGYAASTGSSVYHILSNTFTPDDDHALAFAHIQNDFGSLCLRFQDNVAEVTGPTYSFKQNNSSTFNLEPFTGNTPGSFTGTGIITPVPQGTCD
ncbi:MAG: inverse autotransporter beta domain-containing protein [Chlamydiae bacterium]|nr:inverse autotransporter beta domain-containing protein [Chlamydiota bacterium]